MEMIKQHQEIAAVYIARVFLGFLFFFRGYDAIFYTKLSNVILSFRNSLINKKVSNLLIVAVSYFNSYSELICGTLLIFGLFENAALFLLGLNFIIAAIGFSHSAPMRDSRFVFPRIVLIFFLLFVPKSWNGWPLDNRFFNP